MQNTALRDTYDRIARDWDQDHQHDDWWVEGTNTFISFLPAHARVLDVGCAGGVKTKYLLERELQVWGIDFSQAMITIAKQQVPQGKFSVCALEDIETLQESFQGIFLQAVLLHIPKNEVLHNMQRIVNTLENDGYLYVAVKEQRVGNPEEEVVNEDDYGYPYQRFFSYFSLDEMELLFTQVGLDVVYSEVHPSGKTNWIQVIGKKIYES